MSLVVGTNIGFLEAHQSDDPAGSVIEIHDRMLAQLETSPATATRVTEINWYCNSASEEANFEVAIYSDDGTDEPNVIVGAKDAMNAKGTGIGWKRAVGLNIVISSSTAYWMAIQVDDTPIADTDMDWDTTGVLDLSLTLGVATLPADWGASTVNYSGRTAAIQAIWDTGGEPPVGNAGIMTTNTGFWGATF